MNQPDQAEVQERDTLASTRVAILGLGLMGGSLAMALKGHCAQLLGHDTDPATVHLAQSQQVVDYASTQADEILPSSNLVILATPVMQILSLLSTLSQYHPGPAVVLDIGSTKRRVLAAMQALPACFDPLGGHPICGKATSSLAHAEADLYQGAPFVLCRLPRTSMRAIQLVEQLIQVIGAYPVWLEADEHDRWIAFTSHLPYLLANALVQATPPEAAALVGPGYRSATRLASSYASMLIDLLATNQDMILSGSQAFRQALDQLEGEMQAGSWAQVETFLQDNARNHAELVKDHSNAPQSKGILV